MPRINFKLEEDKSSGSARSNEFAYVLTAENVETKPIDLIKLTPRVPTDAVLVEVKNPTSEADRAKKEKLCKQLEYILNTRLVAFSDEMKKRTVEQIRALFQEVFGLGGNVFAAFMRIGVHAMSGRMEYLVQKNIEKLEVYQEKIEGYEQAEAALHRWFGEDENTDEKKIYISKLAELEKVEKSMKGVAHTALATIEPDSLFSQTYVFKFARNKWEPRKYSICIDGTFSLNGAREFVNTTDITQTISPSPARLTFFAIFASVLGVIVKYCTELQGRVLFLPTSMEDINRALQSPITSTFLLTIPVGIISALVFFNVYERTEVGKKLDVGLSWRSALLIGFLCGLLGERIIAALKALIP